MNCTDAYLIHLLNLLWDVMPNTIPILFNEDIIRETIQHLESIIQDLKTCIG